MESKDQLHQIPENSPLAYQDEKTAPIISNLNEMDPHSDLNQPPPDSEHPSASFHKMPDPHSKETESDLTTNNVQPEVIAESVESSTTASEELSGLTETYSGQPEVASLEPNKPDISATDLRNQTAETSQSSVESVVESQLMHDTIEQSAVDVPEMPSGIAESSGVAKHMADHELSNQLKEMDQEDEEEEEHSAEDQQSYDNMSREELVEHLRILVEEEDINKVKSRVGQIKLTFLRKTKEIREARYLDQLNKETEVRQPETTSDTIEQRFNELFEIYKQKRALYLEKLEKEKLENLRKKQAILERLKNLINSEETLKKTYDEFRALQEEWRSIGLVPKNEAANLWQNYHFLIEKFFDKVRINKELKDLDLKKNLQQKIELCEKVEELLLEPSITKSFKLLQLYHEQWKEIGPVPEDKKDEIWERFKAATEKINERRREYYQKLQEELDKNYQQKLALCEKAEALLAQEKKTLKEWQEQTRQFTDLFKVWRTIGPAPKKYNDAIWERFKTTIDTFFADKKEYLSKIKEQQINNYNLKLELCLQAEALKDSTDWSRTTRELIELQKRWHEIGPVPSKHSEKIWKRFRQACDEFFARKNEHFARIKEEEEENLRKKEELIAAVENHEFGPDRAKNLEILKEYQRKWTEIGFVPYNEKVRLQNAFRNAINKRLDQLNISSEEISFEEYKSRIELVKSSPDGNRQLQREVNSLQKKIDQLRDDIKLWENNIGFLADTRNANLLKAEFEKKIERAKHELSVLEAKLRLITQ